MATATTAPKGVTHARPKAREDKKDGKAKTQTFPSDFGSHASMINAELNNKIVAAKQNAADPWTILTDERGNYATRKSLLDSGLADPNRYGDLGVRETVVKELTKA
ncbi:MAG: hypothetical protein ABSC38_04275 [Verrucomicrobiia bacterium]